MKTVTKSHSYLPEAQDCADYAHYCETRRVVGLQVIPESLFDSLYGESYYYDDICEMDDGA
tara:strand:+ start:6041 stop:6223 length:183 start_codon:yes stop_codon:yes gene_type:complete